MQHVPKNTFSPLISPFFPTQLWRCQWRARRNVHLGYFFEEMGVSRLLKGVCRNAPELTYNRKAKERRSHEATNGFSIDPINWWVFFTLIRDAPVIKKGTITLSMFLSNVINIYHFLLFLQN